MIACYSTVENAFKYIGHYVGSEGVGTDKGVMFNSLFYLRQDVEVIIFMLHDNVLLRSVVRLSLSQKMREMFWKYKGLVPDGKSYQIYVMR